MTEPILITKSVCPSCKAVKRRLAARNITVQEVNADTDDSAADHIQEHGLLAVPVIIDGGKPYRTMQEILDWIRSQSPSQ